MSGRAQKQARRDMEMLEAKYGVDYTGYHRAKAEGREPSKKQKRAYDRRMQEKGKYTKESTR